MQENIRKIVKAARPIPSRVGGFKVQVPLFLRQGWETTKASPSLPSTLPKPRSRRSAAPRNVAKSVAKARKTHQVTTQQLHYNQSHRRNFSQKTPTPPFSAKTQMKLAKPS